MIVLLWIFFTTAILHLFIELKKVLALNSHKRHQNQNDIHPISVIVCAKNELENLKLLVPDLLKQQHPEFEIILILDRCTDKSSEYLNSLQDHRLAYHEIVDVPDGYNPKKFALAIGIQKAQHEWILLTDADCRITSPYWISSYNECIDSDTSVILGVSTYESKSSLLSKFIDYETQMTAASYLASALHGVPYMGVGRNLGYRKSEFEKVNGFSSIASVMGGDDDLLVQQMSTFDNTKILIHSESQTRSNPSNTWNQYFRQKTRHLGVGKYYKKEFQRMLLWRALVHFILWLSFLILVSFSSYWLMVSVIFTLVLVIKGLFIQCFSRLLSFGTSTRLFPILDFCYAVILPLIGVRSFFVKKYSWN